ncbi:MAG: zinc-ribbon domain containing protein, partial [Candidatus Eremiobacterota bacterium]
MYVDRDLTCADCGAQFVFTAGEQAFHASKGFTNEPRRCPGCRSARKTRGGNEGTGGGRPPGGGGGGAAGGSRERFEVTCDECGATTHVPFRPTGTRPVYC